MSSLELNPFQKRVDLRNHLGGLTVPTHDLQHRPEDFGTDLGNAGDFKGVRRDQVRGAGANARTNAGVQDERGGRGLVR